MAKTTENDKPQNWFAKAFEAITDIKLILTAFIALSAGGGAMRVLGDAGVTRVEAAAIADSVTSKKIARQDTAIIQIKFSLDVMMTESQKERADSMMHAALKNIRYGETP